MPEVTAWTQSARLHACLCVPDRRCLPLWLLNVRQAAMGQSMSFGLTQYDVDELIAYCKGACESWESDGGWGFRCRRGSRRQAARRPLAAPARSHATRD